MSDVLAPSNSTSQISLPRSPYKGLMPYTEDDALFFFGRERERERISGNLMASRLTILYGPSGVGKSSVLQAGVAHHLKQQAHQNLVEEGEPEFALIVFNNWRDDPLAGLIRQVQKGVTEALGLDASAQADLANPTAVSLVEALQEWSAKLGGDLLIILDQFEEYFLYHGQEDGPGTFALEFPRAVNRVGLRASFLVSIREDGLAKLDRFKGRIEGLFDNYLRIDYLDREAAREAIEQPLRQYNALLPPGATLFELEPALVEAVLKQLRAGQVQLGDTGQGKVRQAVAKAEGSLEIESDHARSETESRIETPYLQLVMERLWEEEQPSGSRLLRLVTLERLGQAGQIVRTHLDKTMQTLPPAELAIAAQVFRYLVTPSGTKIAHTQADLAVYARFNQAEKATMGLVLARLSSGEVRILRPIPAPLDQPGEVCYEIYHDVLAKAILAWQTRYSTEREQAEAKKANRVRNLRLIGVVLLLGLGLLVVGGLAVFAFVQSSNASKIGEIALSRQLAAQSRNRADTRLDLALLLAVQATQVKDTFEARSSLNDSLYANPPLSIYLQSHSDAVLSVTFSPDGKILASAGGGYNNPKIILWDVANRSKLAVLEGHPRSVYSLAFSPDGKTLASASLDRTIILWDVISRSKVAQLEGHGSGVNSVVFSPDGKTLASASGNDGLIILWDVASRREQSRLTNIYTSVLAFAPNGKTLAFTRADTIILWDVSARREQARLEDATNKGKVFYLAFSPDSKLLASAGENKTINLWDVTTYKELNRLRAHTSAVTGVAFSPDGKTLASSSNDKTLILWNVADSKFLRRLEGHGDYVYSVAFSPDGKTLASGSNDRTIILWDLTLAISSTASKLPRLQGHTDAVAKVAFAPDGKTVASASNDKKIILWEAASRNKLATLEGHNAVVTDLSYSPDGKILASTGADKKVILWDVMSRNKLAELSDGSAADGTASVSQEGYNLAFTPDGKTLATTSPGGKIMLWEVASRSKLAELSEAQTVVTSLAFSPDGKILATGGDKVILWDMSNRTKMAELTKQPFEVIISLAFSPDGKTLATGRQDKTIVLWDVASRKELAQLKGYTDAVTSVTFSPDGKTLASASKDKSILLWDVATRVRLVQLQGHTAGVNSVAFSPNGQTLVSGSDDTNTNVILWDIAVENWQKRACQLANRNLTSDEWDEYMGSNREYAKTCPDLP